MPDETYGSRATALGPWPVTDPPLPPPALGTAYLPPRREPPRTKWTDMADAIEQMIDGITDRADALLVLARALFRLALVVIVVIVGLDVIHILSEVGGVIRSAQTWLTSHTGSGQ